MKRFFVTAMVILLTFSQGAFAAFLDTSTQTTGFDEIDWLRQNGVVEGYRDASTGNIGTGMFGPNDNINRAEFLKMLYGAKGMLGQQVMDVEIPFPDVPDGEWYTEYVRLAYSEGVIEGYPDGTFRPDAPINFAEANKIVMNGFFAVDQIYGDGEKYVPCLDGGDHSDDPKVDIRQWYWKFIYVADGSCVLPYDLSVIKAGEIVPGNNITRADMARMLYRSKAVTDLVGGDYPGIYYSGLAPSNLKDDNEFFPNTVMKGDVVAGMTVSGLFPIVADGGIPDEGFAIGNMISYGNLATNFNGEILVSGHFFENDLSGNYCFELSEDSSYDLPRMYAELGPNFICFSNYEFVNEYIGVAPNLVDEAFILIDNFGYSDPNFQGDGGHIAELVMHKVM